MVEKNAPLQFYNGAYPSTDIVSPTMQKNIMHNSINSIMLCTKEVGTHVEYV
jgi:hypothetical protein